jgi:hypothetical protein
MMTKPPNVTNLDDARYLRRAGLPLGLPLTHREFSRQYSEFWFGLMKAHTHFMFAVLTFSDDESPAKWKLVKRRFSGISKAMRSCDAFVGKLGGRKTPPAFKSQQDEHECRILSTFLVERAMPFAEYWQSAIDAVDDGTPLTIRTGDMPKWVDEDT